MRPFLHVGGHFTATAVTPTIKSFTQLPRTSPDDGHENTSDVSAEEEVEHETQTEVQELEVVCDGPEDLEAQVVAVFVAVRHRQNGGRDIGNEEGNDDGHQQEY